jgi:hypothetical protein
MKSGVLSNFNFVFEAFYQIKKYFIKYNYYIYLIYFLDFLLNEA